MKNYVKENQKNLSVEERKELVALAKEQWPGAIVLEGSYKTISDKFLCQVKIPSSRDKFLKHVKACAVVSIIKNRAICVGVPSHFKKFIKVSGVVIHQNFFIPEKFLGKELWLEVQVSQRFNRGKKEFVVDYTHPEHLNNDLVSQKGHILKLGTPKLEGEKIIKIAPESYITFNKAKDPS